MGDVCLSDSKRGYCNDGKELKCCIICKKYSAMTRGRECMCADNTKLENTPPMDKYPDDIETSSDFCIAWTKLVKAVANREYSSTKED